MLLRTLLLLANIIAAPSAGNPTNEVRSIRELIVCEAERIPVNLEGTVINRWSWNPELKADMLIITEAGESAGVRVSSDTAAGLGDRIAVRGWTLRKAIVGMQAIATEVRLLAHEPLPVVDTDVRSVTEGKFINRMVKVKGTMLDVFQDEIDRRWNWFQLESDGAICNGSVPEDTMPFSRLKTLINASLEIKAICIDNFSGGRRFAGPRIELHSPDQLKVLQSPSEDRFEAPPLRLSLGTNPRGGRHSAEGRVIASWAGSRFFLLTDTGERLEIRLRSGAKLPELDASVKVIGFPETNPFYVKLVMAECRERGGALPQLEPPEDTTATQLLLDSSGSSHIKPSYNGRAIRLRGRLATVSSDGVLMLDSDGVAVRVDAGKAIDPGRLPENGSTVAVSGICLMEFENEYPATGFPRLRGFSLILRNPADVVLLASPALWTPTRLMIVIGMLLVALLAILFWNAMLRIVAERRSRELFRENVARISADLRTDERTRLAIELHDSLAQNLSGVSLQIAAGNNELAAKTLKSCRDELRNCLWDLRSQALDEKDLATAVRTTIGNHIGRASLSVRFNVPRSRISDPTAHAILRIIRELVTNAVRHGGASAVRVAGSLDEDALRFSVRDNGCGFDPASAPGLAQGHFGLQGIRERVRRLNGSMDVESKPGAGTRVTIAIRRQT